MLALIPLLAALLGCGSVFARHAVGVAAPVAASAAAAPVTAAGALPARLARALAAPGLRGAALSVLVVDRVAGQVLFQRDAERALMPASTQKLLTAVAVLAAFGPAHRFETRVEAARPPDAAGAVRNLCIVGADPAMTSEQWWRLAADLRARGLRRVKGDLVLDDRRLDRVRWHPSWQSPSSRAYYAPVGPLSANYGAFRVAVLPGRAPGASAEVFVDPPVDYFKLVSDATTGTVGSRPDLQVTRELAGARERIHVSGSIPAGGVPQDVWRSVLRPGRYAGAVLRLQLAANGIAVAGKVRPGVAPAQPGWMFAFPGYPLAREVTLFLKYSNNFIAEVLVKTLGIGPKGEPGSWSRGVAAVRRQLGALGVSLDGARLLDGSGLSRENRVSARLLVDTLRAADRQPGFGPELLSALPLAGLDGTLRARTQAARGRLRAKTGSLEGVTAMAGLARSAWGRDLFFAILVNGERTSQAQVVQAVDGFAAALAAPASAVHP